MEMMVQSNKMLKKELEEKQVKLNQMANVLQSMKDDLSEDI